MLLCVGILNPKIRVKLSTNVTLSNPFLGLWHEFVLPFQNREKKPLQHNHFLIQKRYGYNTPQSQLAYARTASHMSFLLKM